jgi:glycosyltransferase involved in cell wall biosynthesis
MDSKPEIAIVVPVFNEEGNILPLASEIEAAMQKVPRSYELVFVDDASTDSTPQRISEVMRCNQRVRGLRHEQNAGQSAALWTGIQGTSSPIIVTLDGDCQNDPADLPQLLAALDDCDFVCGVRCNRQDNWLRLVSTRVARWARRTALKVDFCDTGCAFRAFKRIALEGVFPFNGLHRFLPVLVHANGARTKEVSIGHRARVAGHSKYGLRNRLWRGIYDLFAIAWYQKRHLPRITTRSLEPAFFEPAEVEPIWRETTPKDPRSVRYA